MKLLRTIATRRALFGFLVALMVALIWLTRGFALDACQLDMRVAGERAEAPPPLGVEASSHLVQPAATRVAVDSPDDDDRDRSTFYGRLIEQGTIGTRVCVRAVTVVLQPAQAAALGSDGEVRFRQLTISEGQGPEAPIGQQYEVSNGIWTMPVPLEDKAVVSVRVDGRDWVVVDGGSIRAGQYEGEYLIGPPRRCSLVVREGDSVRVASGLSLLAVPSVPEGVEVEMKIKGGQQQARGASSGGARSMPTPPPNAAVIGSDLTSPIVFDSVNFGRDLWIGKEGYQWEQIPWPRDAQDGTVTLQRCVDLHIAVDGVAPESGRLELRVFRNHRLVGSWPQIRGGQVYVLKGIGVGQCRLLVTRPKDVGTPSVLEESVSIPDRSPFEVALSLGNVRRLLRGRLVVGIYDPAGCLPRNAELVLVPTNGCLTNPTGPSRLRVHGSGTSASPSQTDGVFVVESDRVPVGEYLVALAPSGLAKYVIITREEDATVSFDLGESVNMVVRPPQFLGDTRDLRFDWMTMNASLGSEHIVPGAYLLTEAPWSDGAWRFSCVVGPVAFRVRRAGAPGFVMSGVFSATNLSTSVDLQKDASGFGCICVNVRRAPANRDSEVIRSLTSRLVNATGERVIPSFIASQSICADGVSVLRITLTVPFGTICQTASPENAGALKFDVAATETVAMGRQIILSGAWTGD